MNPYERQLSKQSSGIVQRFVKGETSNVDDGRSARASEGEHQEPKIPITSTEKPLSENTELIDNVQMGDFNPISTVEQRRYSAVWDPIQYVTNSAIVSE